MARLAHADGGDEQGEAAGGDSCILASTGKFAHSGASHMNSQISVTMQLQYPNTCALFLDLDGTLIDIAPTPDGVTIPDGLVVLLQSLAHRLQGAVAIVTGRSISDIDRLLAPLKPVAAGVHGAEFRTHDDGEIVNIAQQLDPVILEAVSRLVSIDPGIVIEPKHSSIAVHYRLAPATGPQIERVLQSILANGPDHLILCAGRKVIEIVPKQVSKGTAIETFMHNPTFRGRRPVMIGDDISDQSAFEVAIRLGGLGLKVAGELYAREQADFEDPVHVLAWLSALAERIDA